MRPQRQLGVLLCCAVAVSAIERREQPNVPTTPDAQLSPLTWGDANFIQTTDIHGWLEGHVLEPSYNGDLGDFYSFVVRMKQKARKLKKDLFIVDTGDTHDGNGLSDTTDPKGLVSQPMLTHIPYDILSIGNHELYANEITQDVYHNFVPHWRGRYLTSNVYIKDAHSNQTVPIGEKYTYFTGEFGTRVLAFGFLFDFTGNGNVSVVHKAADAVKETWFSEALLAHTPDMIALIGHTGVRMQEFKTVIKAIRQYYPYLPIAVLGGHTHIRDFAIYDGWAAGIESGRYMETIGFFSVEGIAGSKRFVHSHGYHASTRPSNLTFHRRYLDQNRKTYLYHTDTTEQTKHLDFDTSLGQEITRNITKWRENLRILEPVACAPQDYYMSSVPATHNQSIFKLLTEEVLPNIIRDEARPNPAYIIMNSGGLRYDIYKGNFTLDMVYQITPFVDSFKYIADVPYDAISQILDKMNNQNNTGGYKMKKRSRYDDDYKQHRITNEYSNLTPGYTTKDDLGSDGDDTKHSRIPYYAAETFIATPLPKNDTGASYDLVFTDFVESMAVPTLKALTAKNWTVHPSYGDPGVTANNMWIRYAEKFWPRCG
ncbi:Metallo-dependent phosphatase-like protein [Syncephalastrum racemosum]|uniref:Metallo-dependent phosphatase-like protein n=1 Tax=Syncephalastrum racemosum TaxID=13706 RepID=A0A1X2HQB4_SYNRA|nr:Metallo-dependent phosphatase-like protein [Syncephalastrum racemosum]